MDLPVHHGGVRELGSHGRLAGIPTIPFVFPFFISHVHTLCDAVPASHQDSAYQALTLSAFGNGGMFGLGPAEAGKAKGARISCSRGRGVSASSSSWCSRRSARDRRPAAGASLFVLLAAGGLVAGLAFSFCEHGAHRRDPDQLMLPFDRCAGDFRTDFSAGVDAQAASERDHEGAGAEPIIIAAEGRGSRARGERVVLMTDARCVRGFRHCRAACAPAGAGSGCSRTSAMPPAMARFRLRPESPAPASTCRSASAKTGEFEAARTRIGHQHHALATGQKFCGQGLGGKKCPPVPPAAMTMGFRTGALMKDSL